MRLFISVAASLLLLQGANANPTPCAARELPTGIVCVCNATYCDEIPSPDSLTSGQAAVYTTSRAGLRLDQQVLTSTSTKPDGTVTISFNTNVTKQTILGFGAAFTDATGANLRSLPDNMADRIIKQYFSPDGLGYTVGRVPIASCDFSTRVYSYDDFPNDFTLLHFNLTVEDFNWKIPYIKVAQSYASQLKLFASPWAAPGWMKTNGQMQDGGQLKGDFGGPYWQTWTKYLIKFFEEYAKNDVYFWAMTPQNEPANGNIKGYPFQTMFFSPEMERDFISTLLGPALKKNPVTRNMTIIIVDDNRNQVPIYADIILADKLAASYVSGIGTHFYNDEYFEASILSGVHDNHPEKFILATEACAGWQSYVVKPLLGSWDRAEQFAWDIIGDLNNWSVGWIDWNMALDQQAGPNWANNAADGNLIVFANQTEYYKQPTWYSVGHFSKFIKPGAVWTQLDFDVPFSGLQSTGYINPDGSKVAVLFNQDDSNPQNVVFNDNGNYYNFTIDSHSIQTVYIK